MTTRTVVMFRQWRAKRDQFYGDGVIALFPMLPANVDGGRTCESYEHVGQHGAADPAGVIARTRPAAPEAYAALLRELQSTPYDYELAVIARTPPGAAEARRRALSDRPEIHPEQET